MGSGQTSTPTTPQFVFEADSSLEPYQVSPGAYLAAHPAYDAVATGALVFHTDAAGVDRLLIQQRAAHDSMPGRWETPGGGCDPDDATILHGVARELWEESGLAAAAVVARVGTAEHVFFTRRGLRVVKLNFEVRVRRGEGPDRQPPRVTLDPNEHQAFLWVTEGECRAGRKGEMEFGFTTAAQEAVIWDGFARRRAEAEGAGAAAGEDLIQNPPVT